MPPNANRLWSVLSLALVLLNGVAQAHGRTIDSDAINRAFQDFGHSRLKRVTRESF